MTASLSCCLCKNHSLLLLCSDKSTCGSPPTTSSSPAAFHTTTTTVAKQWRKFRMMMLVRVLSVFLSSSESSSSLGLCCFSSPFSSSLLFFGINIHKFRVWSYNERRRRRRRLVARRFPLLLPYTVIPSRWCCEMSLITQLFRSAFELPFHLPCRVYVRRNGGSSTVISLARGSEFLIYFLCCWHSLHAEYIFAIVTFSICFHRRLPSSSAAAAALRRPRRV